MVLLLSATFGYGFSWFFTCLLRYSRLEVRQRIIFYMRRIFDVESFVYSANLLFITISFHRLDFRNYQILRLRLLIFVIRERHDAREYPNTDAMGITFLSEGFHNAEHKCRRRLRHKNFIGRRGAAPTRISVAWLGRIYPFSAESSYSGGQGRGSDVSTPIGPTNVAQSF